MFRVNENHQQGKLFTVRDEMVERVQKRFDSHWSNGFYQKVFYTIDEKSFSPLYNLNFGRCNFPVNILASLEILKEMLVLTDEQLIDRYYFDLSIRNALGLQDINEHPLSPRTFYYFRESVAEYELEKGINLVMKLFEDGRDKYIKDLGIKTGYQRTDSTMIGANIKRMNQLTLFHKVLSNLVKEIIKNGLAVREEIQKIVSKDEDAFAYRLKNEDVQKYLKEMAEYLFELTNIYSDNKIVSETKSYKYARRLLKEQCKIEEETSTIELKSHSELSASSMQNSSDPDATYRKKNKESHWGYAAHAVETCDPENKVQIILDVSVAPNNYDDAKVLSEKIEEYKQDYELETLIVDGGYVSDEVREKCAENDIELIATAIKGKKKTLPEEIEGEEKLTTADFKIDESTEEIETCPMGQKPVSQSYEDNTRCLTFDPEICGACEKRDVCPVVLKKNEAHLEIDIHRKWLDEHEKKMQTEEYQKLCNLRPPVEGLMSALKPKYLKGRTLFRGLKKVQSRIIYKAIGINFKRIKRFSSNFLLFFLRQFASQGVFSTFQIFATL